ncbi:MAG: PH domain-containing protein [Candidatus Limnocylindrales bacterium]
MASEGFHLDFVITPAHMVDFLRLMQKNVNRIGTVAGLVLILAGLYFLVSGSPGIGIFEMVIGVLMILAAQTRYFDALRARLLARAVIGTRAQLDVTESGVDVSNAGASRHFDWSAITDLRVSEAMIVLVRDRRAISWIPTSAFASAADRQRALDYLRSHIAAPAAR